MEDNLTTENKPVPKSGRRKIILRIISYILVFALGVQTAYLLILAGGNGISYQTLSNIKRLDYLFRTKYYKEYDTQLTQDGILAGMVFGLDDNFSYYLTKEATDSYDQDIEGNYVGIGVTISPDENNYLKVVAPFDGSPAQKAGVLPGDIIYKVNGTEYQYDEVDKAVSEMKGKKGESVDIEIMREGTDNFPLTIVKDNIEIESVVGKRIDDSTCYIRISRFDVTTAEDFSDMLSELKVDKNTDLILDLRDNPGGVVKSATDIADNFIDSGNILTIKYKSGEEEVTEAKENKIEVKYPIAVLVNENSASASEIVSGALKDTEAGYLIGKKTFGKGVVNQKFPLYGGSSAVLTVAEYLTPSGSSIHEIGIEPDLESSIDESIKKSVAYLSEEEDTQLKDALSYLSSRK